MHRNWQFAHFCELMRWIYCFVLSCFVHVPYSFYIPIVLFLTFFLLLRSQCLFNAFTTLYNISDFTLISGKRETHKLFSGKRRKSRQVVGMDTHMGPSYMRKHVWHMFNFNQLHSTWFVHSDCIIFMFYVCYFSIFLDLEIWGSRNEQEWVSDFGKCMRHREVYSRWILVIGNLPL